MTTTTKTIVRPTANGKFESVLMVRENGLAVFGGRAVGDEKVWGQEVMVRAINGAKLHRAMNGGRANCNGRMKISGGLRAKDIATIPAGAVFCEHCFGDAGAHWVEMAKEAIA